ncbi:MAG TPA: hypothetical protein VK550_20120 [Polyangiaceae bacterium]|nr:hypothetical protein [Polyangiaceae bacterium]
MRYHQLAFIPLLFPLIGALSNCGAYGRGFGALDTVACPELGGNADALSAQYAANARANAKIRTFVQAAKDLAGVSIQIENEAAEACRRMAFDIGMTAQEMAPKNEPGGNASGSCAALSARLDALFRQGISVRASATPPQCQVNAQAGATCDAACSAELDPGEIVARCDPGKLSGICQGQCSGRCDGRCNGACNGNCSARDARGNCVGACSGDCNGACDATCHARCQGTWQAPRCEGYVRPPTFDAECNASCRAHASIHASCTPAIVNVQVSQNAALAARLAATMQANLPALLHAELALGRRVLGDAQVIGQVGAELPKIVGNAGAHALACIAASTNATARASISIRVSVQASASVSGKVGASG